MTAAGLNAGLIQCPGPRATMAELDRFALSYDAYRRIGSDSDQLFTIVAVVVPALDIGVPVPEAVGLDLLRASLFFLHRRAHFAGGDPEHHFRDLAARIHKIVGIDPLPCDEL